LSRLREVSTVKVLSRVGEGSVVLMLEIARRRVVLPKRRRSSENASVAIENALRLLASDVLKTGLELFEISLRSFVERMWVLRPRRKRQNFHSGRGRERLPKVNRKRVRSWILLAKHDRLAVRERRDETLPLPLANNHESAVVSQLPNDIDLRANLARESA